MNLLLVDDEITIIQILLKAIDWEALGIREVYTAYNAMEAKKIIEVNEIRIMICDIEMPQESGLDLIRWIRDRQKEIACIILTAYPNFNYAKDAIDLNVDTYLLKPVVFDELKNVVGKTIQKIREQKRENSYRKYGEDIIADKNKAARVLMQSLFYETIPITEESVRREIDKLGLELDIRDKVSLIMFRAKEEKEVQGKGKIIRFAFENIGDELFKDAYIFCAEYTPVFMIKEPVSAERIKEICMEYRQVCNKYVKVDMGAYICRNITLLQMSMAFDLLRETAVYLSADTEAIHYVEPEHKETNERIEAETDRKNSVRPEIEQVKHYLEEHYQEAITREDIEQYMHLNGDYLNRIYKSAMGFSLMEYIQHLRIEKAKKLLRETSDSISEICGQTGYDSPPYFAKIFKKQTGQTPSEYREGKQ